MRIRDIHLFDERFPSVYTTGVTVTNQASFFTLPFVDGYLWSSPQKTAGMRLKAVINGEQTTVLGKDPVITRSANGNLHIRWPLTNIEGELLINVNESTIDITMEGNPRTIAWYFEMSTAEGIELPYSEINPEIVNCRFEGMNYSVKAIKGTFATRGNVFTLTPTGKNLVLKPEIQ